MVYRRPRSTWCPHVLRSFTQSDLSTLSPPSIFIPSISINLQIPLPATPFFSHLYKTPGVWGSPLWIFPPRPSRPPDFQDIPGDLLCLHAFPNSLSRRKNSSPLQSAKSKLFQQNTGGGGTPQRSKRGKGFAPTKETVLTPRSRPEHATTKDSG